MWCGDGSGDTAWKMQEIQQHTCRKTETITDKEYTGKRLVIFFDLYLPLDQQQ
jgi:hypothetical protein